MRPAKRCLRASYCGSMMEHDMLVAFEIGETVSALLLENKYRCNTWVVIFGIERWYVVQSACWESNLLEWNLRLPTFMIEGVSPGTWHKIEKGSVAVSQYLLMYSKLSESGNRHWLYASERVFLFTSINLCSSALHLKMSAVTLCWKYSGVAVFLSRH